MNFGNDEGEATAGLQHEHEEEEESSDMDISIDEDDQCDHQSNADAAAAGLQHEHEEESSDMDICIDEDEEYVQNILAAAGLHHEHVEVEESIHNVSIDEDEEYVQNILAAAGLHHEHVEESIHNVSIDEDDQCDQSSALTSTPHPTPTLPPIDFEFEHSKVELFEHPVNWTNFGKCNDSCCDPPSGSTQMSSTDESPSKNENEPHILVGEKKMKNIELIPPSFKISAYQKMLYPLVVESLVDDTFDCTSLDAGL